MTRFHPPASVRDIARRLESAGFETWCVGGAVRDALLGQAHLDWDLATAATPPQVRKLFRRTVPVGIEFGTVGVLDDAGVMHEVTTFRRDVKTDGRHAEVEFGASLDEDLARRDFTINAIAYSPSRDEVRDPFGGQDDLRARIVRAVGVADQRMREDRLRALRAFRFAGRFGFTVERETWRAIIESVPFLGRLSPERVKQELEKTMEQVEHPSASVRLWRESGALSALVPPLSDLHERNLRAIDALARPALTTRPQRKVNRIAALFFGLGGDAVTNALRALRFSNADVAWIASLAGHWLTEGEAMTAALGGGGRIDDAQLRRWAAAIGRTRFAPFLRIAAAFWRADVDLGTMPAGEHRRVGSIYRRAVRIAYRDPIALADLAVDGGDLMQIGMPAGPQLGETLHALLEFVVADPGRNTRERLIDEARRMAGQSP